MTGTDQQLRSCIYCDDFHAPRLCTTFTTGPARITRLKQLGRCERCMRKHPGPKCEIPLTPCFLCQSMEHHTWLHLRDERSPLEGEVREPRENPCTPHAPGPNQESLNTAVERVAISEIISTARPTHKHDLMAAYHGGVKVGPRYGVESDIVGEHSVGDRDRNPLPLNDSNGDFPSIALATALIDVQWQGKTYKLRAFFDIGSQRSLVSKAAVNKLGLPTFGSVDLRMAGINSTGPLKRYGVTNLTVRMGGICSRVPAIVLDTVVEKIYTPGLVEAAEFLRTQGIILADTYESDEIRNVDVLIGADAYCSFVIGHRLANRNINLL